MDAKLGSLEPGKIVDRVILNANPLESPRTCRRINTQNWRYGSLSLGAPLGAVSYVCVLLASGRFSDGPPPFRFQAIRNEWAEARSVPIDRGVAGSVIRPGALADLLLVEGNPVADLTLLEQAGPALPVIMKSGRFHQRAL